MASLAASGATLAAPAPVAPQVAAPPVALEASAEAGAGVPVPGAGLVVLTGAQSASEAAVAPEPTLPPAGDSFASDDPTIAPAPAEPYSGRVFLNQAKAIPWRLGGATAAITATGVANWDWFSSPFRFKSEGWFGKDTASLGMDKLGHAYSGYVLSEFFTDGIEGKLGPNRHAPVTAGILAMGLMTYIEVFDGFSKEHGFSHEDLAVDAAGILFSVARRRIPGLREKVDFRLLYKPTGDTLKALGCFPKPHCDKDGATFRSPITDYSSQKYLLAFKLSGFGDLKRTPLRYVELHTGYYARGFTPEDRREGKPLRQRIFFGAGLNVSELLFPSRNRSGFAKAGRSVLEYLQLPWTSVYNK